MNVLILMAATSDPFEQAGYPYPRNLVEAAGIPLIQRVIESLASPREAGATFIFALQRSEVLRHHTADVIRLLLPDAVIVEAHGRTGGAACTALLAIDHINGDEPLLILNGDEVRNVDLQAIVEDFQGRELDGGVVVFEAVHPRWSFVRCDENGLVVETAEKRPISNLATTGAYYFARGSDFVVGATKMIKKDACVDGKFYVCPVYNELILNQAKIGVTQIDRGAYFKLTSPQEVRAYEAHLHNQHERLTGADSKA